MRVLFALLLALSLAVIPAMRADAASPMPPPCLSQDGVGHFDPSTTDQFQPIDAVAACCVGACVATPLLFASFALVSAGRDATPRPTDRFASSRSVEPDTPPPRF